MGFLRDEWGFAGSAMRLVICIGAAKAIRIPRSAGIIHTDARVVWMAIVGPVVIVTAAGGEKRTRCRDGACVTIGARAPLRPARCSSSERRHAPAAPRAGISGNQVRTFTVPAFGVV